MKAQRIERLSNVARLPLMRIAVVVAPAFAALLALGGVTAPRAVSINALRASVEAVRARAEEYRRESAVRRGYLANDVEERALRAVAEARSHTPDEVDPIVAQGFVRVACDRAGIELETLTVGGERDPLAPVVRDRVVVRVIDLAGSARPRSILDLLDELDALGSPACVLQLNLDARADGDARVEFRLQLGLFHFAEPVFADPSDEPEPTPESL